MVRKKRSDRGLVRLTDRDLVTLRWVGEQYAVRLDVLQHLLGRDTQQPTKEPGVVTESTARRVVGRWKTAGLVESRKFFFGAPEWVWLTTNGLAHLNLRHRVWMPKVGMLDHYHFVNLVRLRIENTYKEPFSWRGERELRRSQSDSTNFHVPDAELSLAAGVIGIEVELTQKSQQRLVDILDKLAEQYEQVWYFVNETTRPLLEAATTRFDEDAFHLYDIRLTSLDNGSRNE